MCRIVRLCLLSCTLLVSCSSVVSLDDASAASSPHFETVHTSNAAILNRLGLTPLEIPDGHHKKRLAGPEPPGLASQIRIHQPYSRRHGHRDSHVYIVKLPASPPYYTITKAHKPPKDEKLTKAGANFPMGFQGNGKPAKIYHWNLPLVKRITEKKRLQAQIRMDQAKKRQQVPSSLLHQDKMHSGVTILPRHGQEPASSDKRFYSADKRQGLHHKSTPAPTSTPTSGKHYRNNDKRLSYPESDKFLDAGKKNLANKTYRLEDSGLHRIHLSNELIHATRNNAFKLKKHRKKAAMSYYAPIPAKPPGTTTSIHKNFNGKPKAFYVMEKSRKPVYYHHLLS